MSKKFTARRHGQRGFSLTEVAVALSVAGLLIGGVLKGVEMMEQARIIKSGALLEQTAMGHQLFMDKYHYMPGDLPGADQLLPAKMAVSDNGNGDNILTVEGDAQAKDGWTFEAYNYWSHLAAAGFGPSAAGFTLKDDTSLASGTTAKESVVEGAHFPTFPLGGHLQVVSGATARANTDASTRTITSVLGDTAAAFPQIRLNELFYRVGSNPTSGTDDQAVLEGSGQANMSPAVTAVDSFRLDMKFDDGRPSSGRLQTTTTSCIATGATNTLLATQYDYNNATATKSSACTLLYRAANSGGSTAIAP